MKGDEMMNPQHFNCFGNDCPSKSTCRYCFVAGPTGATGATGPTGPTGPATTLVTVGTTTTGAPGTDASVTNVGTGTNAVLDFVIPSGITGPTGPTHTLKSESKEIV